MESYNKILEYLSNFQLNTDPFVQNRKPKLSNLELVSVALTAEYLSIDSECQLFRKLPIEIANRIERSVYNRRKRKLFTFMESLRVKLADAILEFEDTFIVDSMPIEVCKLSRSSRSKICRETYESAPDKGYCASQNIHYFGYKFHGVCGLNGVLKSFDLSKASVHDIHYLKDIKTQLNDCTILGDKGYISADYQIDLFENNKIKLEVPMRSNQKNYQPQKYIFRKARKRIETILSQLCDQFMIRRNYAKTFEGLKTRLLSKITSMTLIQSINFHEGRKIGKVKISII